MNRPRSSRVRSHHYPSPGKAVGKDAAFEVLTKGLADIGLGGVVVALAIELTCAGEFMPGLEVLGYGLVEQRALGVARVVELGFCTRWPAFRMGINRASGHLRLTCAALAA